MNALIVLQYNSLITYIKNMFKNKIKIRKCRIQMLHNYSWIKFQKDKINSNMLDFKIESSDKIHIVSVAVIYACYVYPFAYYSTNGELYSILFFLPLLGLHKKYVTIPATTNNIITAITLPTIAPLLVVLLSSSSDGVIGYSSSSCGGTIGVYSSSSYGGVIGDSSFSGMIIINSSSNSSIVGIMLSSNSSII